MGDVIDSTLMHINDLPISIPNKFAGRYVNTNDLPKRVRIRIPILYLNPVKFAEKHNYLSVQIAK